MYRGCAGYLGCHDERSEVEALRRLLSGGTGGQVPHLLTAADVGHRSNANCGRCGAPSEKVTSPEHDIVAWVGSGHSRNLLNKKTLLSEPNSSQVEPIL
jgi:hypothetical protein